MRGRSIDGDEVTILIELTRVQDLLQAAGGIANGEEALQEPRRGNLGAVQQVATVLLELLAALGVRDGVALIAFDGVP